MANPSDSVGTPPSGAGAGFELPATLTMSDVTAELARLDGALAAAPVGAALRIDASKLQQFDTSALALLMQARRQAKAQGRPVELRGQPPRLVELARLYGVAELL
jgi:phospholipid transport system transporter-binding protein